MLKIARRPPVRSTRNASRTIPALSRRWWSAYWQLAKSIVPEANGNAELSPWTQPISADLARAWRSTPSDPSNPRADEFATEEDDNGAATWRRIADAVEQLANTAPSGP